MLSHLIKRLTGQSASRLPKLNIIEHRPGFWTVRTEGLAAQSVPELEMVEIPEKLVSAARYLLLEFAVNGLATPGSLAAGKRIGGKFAHPKQSLLEYCAFEHVDADRQDDPVLRVCDYDTRDPHACPRKLLVAHLCASAERESTDNGLALYQVAVDEYPPVYGASNAKLEDSALNPNNFWAWEGLASGYADKSDVARAVEAWKRAICRWPRFGKLLASRILAHVRKGTWDVGRDRLLTQFWASVDDATIRQWCSELGMDLPEAALGP